METLEQPESISADPEKHLEQVRARINDRKFPDYVPGAMGEEDPEVIYTDENSAKRILWSGEDLLEVQLPPGTRVIYPKKPMRGLKNVPEAIRYSLLNPEDSEPLPRQLKRGMKLTICIDDISMPLPPMVKPDIRQTMLEIILEYVDAAGVDDVHLIIATAFHRRMTEAEMKRMVGNKIFDRFYPDRYYNHDGEDSDGMKWLGHTEAGEAVHINRRAAESDLIIYTNVNFVPMNGGHKSVATGLAGYRTLREHHDPEVIAASKSYMDPSTSALADANKRIGKFIEERVKVFHVESAVNSAMFGAPLSFFYKNEDEYSFADRKAKDAVKYSLSRLNHKVKRRIFKEIPAPYEPIAIHSGHVDPVHDKIIQAGKRQYIVNVKGQADILVFGMPFVCPYSVNSILNPLLIQVMALGYIYHLFDGGIPLLKEGGTMIFFHPCRDEFDPKFHPSYIEFFNRLLPESTDSRYLQKKYEHEFATNPEYIKMYREGNAYHGVHAFYMWYWGETGRRRVGKVIAVGAEDKHVPVRMGWENAETFEQSLEMAKAKEGEDAKVTFLHLSPMLLTKCV